MKIRHTSIALICLTLLPALSFSQENKRKNTLKANLLSPFWDAFSLAFEHEYKPDNSLQFGMAYMNLTENVSSENKNNTTGLFLTAEYRYSLDVKHIETIYIAPFMRFITTNYKEDGIYYVYDPSVINTVSFNASNSSSYQSLGLGLLFGKQFILRDRLVFDLFAGPVYSFLVQESVNVDPRLTRFGSPSPVRLFIKDEFSERLLKSYGVRAGINIGYRF